MRLRARLQLQFLEQLWLRRHAVLRERAVTGYDRHRKPVYGYRTASHNCRPSNGQHSNLREPRNAPSSPSNLSVVTAVIDPPKTEARRKS